MFQRDRIGAGNSKRSLSKNSCKSANSIKNRARSAYSYKGLRDMKDK